MNIAEIEIKELRGELEESRKVFALQCEILNLYINILAEMDEIIAVLLSKQKALAKIAELEKKCGVYYK